MLFKTVPLLLIFPVMLSGQEWKKYEDLEKAGWSVSKLEEAGVVASTTGTAAVLVVDRGNVVAAWGHIDHPYKSASIRKSIYDVTMGAAHYLEPFDVNASMKSLEIDDIDALSDREKAATLEHLMMARSGIYHPAAYETASNAARRPERQSAAPGTNWYYNNWDFNLTCEAFERLTGETIADAFIKNISGPLGMEDFEKHHIYDVLEPRLSRYPAVTFRLSARDLARIGKLYLQDGEWKGKRIVSSQWIKRSTTPTTVFEEGSYRGEGNAYGKLWWIFPARPELDSPYQAHHRVAALGSGGQIMVLFPELDLVIVHLADTDRGRGLRDSDVTKLMDRILGARKTKRGTSKLESVSVEKLSDKNPIPIRSDYSLLTDKQRDALEGTYMFTEQEGMTLYPYEKRLFLQPIGMPLNDVEVLQVSDGSLRSPLVSLVVEPVFNDEMTVDEIQVTFRGQKMNGKRKQ
jgi:hypothetical protein